MIYQALKIVIHELNAYLNDEEMPDDDKVVLGNISQLENSADNGGQANSLENKIVVTLVNIEEEKTLKNRPNYLINSSREAVYKNPPVALNLFVLFSVTSSKYENALKYLSRIIAFFQGKNVFTNVNTPIPLELNLENMEWFKLILDLYSPSFEETNHLWATLGGKQMPSALYKMRLTEIERDHTHDIRGVIKEVQVNEEHIN